MISTDETAGETLKCFKFRVEIPGLPDCIIDSVQVTEVLTPKIDKTSTQGFWEEWANQCKESNKLPETVDYGTELGEGDYIAGAVTSKGVLIASEFDEIDEDTEISVLYVRRRNGQMDFITHDTVYMNTYPVGYKTKEKK